MDKIKTAILGYGRSGSTMHAGPIEKLEDFEMAAVCDIDPKRRDQASKRFGCPVYEDYRQMLEKEHLDLVCVITRSDQHCEMSYDCLKAGTNVLVTKPWAANAAEAERMVSTAGKSEKKIFPWLPARWGSDLKRLKELKRENAIGDIFIIRRAVSHFATRSDWQTERRYAGGYLLNWGPHIIDPAVLLAGGRIKSVYGTLRQTINPGDVEDIFMALISMDNGVTIQAELTVSLAPLPSWLVQGKKGTIKVEGQKMTILQNMPANPDDPTQAQKMTSKDTTNAKEETLEGDLYGDQYKIYAELAAAVRGEKEFAVKPEDALELSRILDAVRTASTENRTVSL